MEKKKLHRLFDEWRAENHPAMPLDMHPGYLLAFAGGVYAAEEEQAEKVCQWERDIWQDCYHTGCKNAFTILAGDALENEFRFCPFCGGRIEEVEDIE